LGAMGRAGDVLRAICIGLSFVLFSLSAYYSL